MANEVDLRTLKRAVDVILDHVITDLGIERLSLNDDRDFYWEVPTAQLYGVKGQQPSLDVGRLSDDWEFVRDLPASRAEAVSLMLVHIAPLLRYVGEEVGQ